MAVAQLTEEEVLEFRSLLKLMRQSLKYTPTVYQQIAYLANGATQGIDFALEYKQTEIPYDSLLFFVPAYSSSGPANLHIKLPTTVNGEVRYVTRTFPIEVETNNGTLRRATLNDIIAYRMCIFRFQKGSDYVILINSPLYDSAIFSNLRITNATFINRPVLENSDNVNENFSLATSEELSNAVARIKSLEDKIIYGTQDPEEVLQNYPVGTIYIKVEEDG